MNIRLHATYENLLSPERPFQLINKDIGIYCFLNARRSVFVVVVVVGVATVEDGVAFAMHDACGGTMLARGFAAHGAAGAEGDFFVRSLCVIMRGSWLRACVRPKHRADASILVGGECALCVHFCNVFTHVCCRSSRERGAP